MGSKGFPKALKHFTTEHFAEGKVDLATCFILRTLGLAKQQGYVGMITIPSWMFNSSLAALRSRVLDSAHIQSLLHNGRGVWGSDYGSCSFVLCNVPSDSIRGVYRRLFERQGEVNSNEVLQEHFRDTTRFGYHTINASQLRLIEGQPIAYWLNDTIRNHFATGTTLGQLGIGKHGMSTSDNDRFLRSWQEVSINNTKFDAADRVSAVQSEKKWFPFNKGGQGRRWYGNNSIVVNWFNDGKEIKRVTDEKYPYLNGNLGFVIGGESHYFSPGITWSSISIASPTFRDLGHGYVICNKGQVFYPYNPTDTPKLLALLNSCVSSYVLEALSPGVGFEVGYVLRLPVVFPEGFNGETTLQLVALARADWDNSEMSWEFRDCPLLRCGLKATTLEESWQKWRSQCDAAISLTKKLETNNNALFIRAYGLEAELTSEVGEEEISLTRAEVRKDVTAFLSHAVGCMMGRYSLDAPGLILAAGGDTVENYVKNVGRPLNELSFTPNDDGIIPVLEGDWFEDDVVARTRAFLRAAFGEATLRENIRFIEESLGKDLRKYFVNDFYRDHIQTYKRRPIYWLVQSPSKGFSVLFYLHRYTRDTMNRVLNRYLREYQTKLRHRVSHLAQVQTAETSSARDKTTARKEVDKLTKILRECEEWERDTLLPLAQARIELDLDDGVKTNYLKLGEALAPIPGLAAADE
jgi:hypothetical protein